MGNHKNHIIENLENFIPTSKEIKDLQKKIKQKAEFYKELIYKINLWKIKIITKAEQLIQNLEKEITILERIILNFNSKFMNYTYYNNFHYLNNFVKDNINNEYLKKFKDNPYFREQSLNLILFSFFYPKKRAIKMLKPNIENYYSLNHSIPEKINNKYYYDISDNTIAYYNKTNNKFTSYLNINDFKEKVYTISLSLDKKIIYACLNDKKIVKFLYFDEKEFSKKKQEIIDNEDLNSHFNKCIQLTDKYLATADNNSIKIWKDNNKEQLEIEKKIVINTKISDLLLINDEYFISSQPDEKTIIIINIKSFEISNTISNIDCIASQNSLFSFQNFIIINCLKGIQLLFKETREITQNIQDFDDDLKKKDLYIYNNRLYILEEYECSYYSSNIKLSIFEFSDGLLEKIQEYDKIKIDEKNLKIMVMNDEQIFLLGEKMHILSKKA